jgi:hypothetical protein
MAHTWLGGVKDMAKLQYAERFVPKRPQDGRAKRVTGRFGDADHIASLKGERGHAEAISKFFDMLRVGSGGVKIYIDLF